MKSHSQTKLIRYCGLKQHADLSNHLFYHDGPSDDKCPSPVLRLVASSLQYFSFTRSGSRRRLEAFPTNQEGKDYRRLTRKGV